MLSSNTVDTEQKKDRPYVIMSRNSVNDLEDNVVGVPLTTRVHKASSFRIKLPVTEIIKDASYSGSIEESVALTDQIRVLAVSRLMRKVGRLSDAAIIAVGLGLSFLFDIS